MHPKIVKLVEFYRRSPWGGPVHSVLAECSVDLNRTIGGRLDFDGLPSTQLLDGPPNPDGTSAWKLLDSPITEAMTVRFEGFLGRRLPKLFKSYLQHKCVPGGYLFEADLPAIDPEAPLSWLEWSCVHSLQPGFPSDGRYYPLCALPADAGLLCVDSLSPSGDEDFKLVALRRDHQPPPAPTPGATDLPVVFDSFEAYVDFIVDWLTYSISRPAPDFSEWLARERKPIPHAYYAAVYGRE